MNDGKSWLEVLEKTPITKLDVGSAAFRRRARSRGFRNLIDLLQCPDNDLDNIFDYQDVDSLLELKIAYRADPKGFAREILGSGADSVVLASRRSMERVAEAALKPQQGEDWIIDELIKLGLRYVDKRDTGGCLWVIGGEEIAVKVKGLVPMGVEFKYSVKGSKTTRNKPGWWISGRPEKVVSAEESLPFENQGSVDPIYENGAAASENSAVSSAGKKISEQTRDILKVLAEAGEACTYGYLSFELPQYDFGELADIIDLLKMQHIVTEGSNGIELIKTDSANGETDDRAPVVGAEVDPADALYVTDFVVSELSWNSRSRATDNISMLELPARAENALKGAGVANVSDLVAALSDAAIYGLGEKSVAGIRAILERRALPLDDAFAPFAQALTEPYASSGFCFDPFGILCLAEDCSTSQVHASNEAERLAANTELSLRRKGYPIPQGAFEAISFGFDGYSRLADADERENGLREFLGGPNSLQRACEIELIRQMKVQAEAVMLGVAANDIPVPNTDIWRRAAIGVTRERRWCSYDAKAKAIIFVYPRFITWIDSFDFDERKVLKTRFMNRPFTKCAEDTRFDAAGAQKFFQAAVKARPYFEDDKYRHLVSTYLMTSEQFASVTGEGMRTLNYLKLYPCKDSTPTLPLVRAIDDEQVPLEVRRIIKNMTDLGSIETNGELVHLDVQSIAGHLVRLHASDSCISLEELIDYYRGFLEENRIPADAAVVTVKSSKDLRKVLDDCQDVLVSSRPGANRVIRHYDHVGKRFSQLTKIFTNARLRNCECSMLVLFCDPNNSELMDEFDIQDEYELHSIVKKYCRTSKGWALGKSPMVTIGKADRTRQVLNLIKELSPATANALAVEYEKIYGVKQTSFAAGGYLKPFQAYERNGKYIYSGEKLPKSQQEYLEGLLHDDFHPLSLIRERFHDKYPKASVSAINGLSVRPLGYRVSGGLLVKDGVDERKAFGALIDSHESFSLVDEDFGMDIAGHAAFKAELNSRLKSFDLLEWEKGSFLSYRRLYSSFGGAFRKSDFEGYVDHAFNYLSERAPFTVFSLRKAGFTHKLDRLRDELGFEDFFYDSILLQGKQNAAVKSTRYGKVSVFCRTPNSFSAADLIESVVEREGAIEVDDLLELLLDKYNVQTSAQSIRSLKTELYYNDRLDMLFDGFEVFQDYARGLL